MSGSFWKDWTSAVEMRAGLTAAGQSKADLPALKGTDPRKVVLAVLLWRRTTVWQ